MTNRSFIYRYSWLFIHEQVIEVNKSEVLPMTLGAGDGARGDGPRRDASSLDILAPTTGELFMGLAFGSLPR